MEAIFSATREVLDLISESLPWLRLVYKKTEWTGGRLFVTLASL